MMTGHSFWTDGPQRMRRVLLVKQAEIDYVIARMKQTSDPGTMAELGARLERLLMDERPSRHEIARSLDAAS
jgi:hypothetical protein